MSLKEKLFTIAIMNKGLLLFLAVEASLPEKGDLGSDGLNDAFHALHFQQLQTLHLHLELGGKNKNIITTCYGELDVLDEINNSIIRNYVKDFKGFLLPRCPSAYI